MYLPTKQEEGVATGAILVSEYVLKEKGGGKHHRVGYMNPSFS
jgi:hypothetical protein